jgi:predicted ATPase
MLKKLTVKDFSAVSYLAGSALIQAHGGTLKFSTKKPNVLVGPNGAGKSAVLTTLALRFLAYFTGQSAFDDNYTGGNDCDVWWSNACRWGNDWDYLKGLEVVTDNAPALYYRPNHNPGNEDNLTTAMMVGYFEQAKEFDRATAKKSSGQANQAMLDKVLKALDGEQLPSAMRYVNWSRGKELKDLEQMHASRSYVGPWDWRAEVLKKLMTAANGAAPLILMDEPEQSLDARAEAQLWRAIAKADCSRMQVIVATHSLFPLLHPKAFNIIEAEPGFAQQVLELNEAIAA